MPRADKAAFIQGMLSEHQLRQQREATKPVPDSKEWWRDVAQGLGVELTALRATIAEQAATIARLEGERDALRARVKELGGILPELPPFPPHEGKGEPLPRYGLRWNGPTQPLAVPMVDGYWTPWHLADAALKEQP